MVNNSADSIKIVPEGHLGFVGFCEWSTPYKGDDGKTLYNGCIWKVDRADKTEIDELKRLHLLHHRDTVDVSPK